MYKCKQQLKLTWYRVQRIPATSNLTYSDCLLHLHIKSPHRRGLYCDLVLIYKIMHGFSAVKFNDIGVSQLSIRQTRSYGFD